MWVKFYDYLLSITSTTIVLVWADNYNINIQYKPIGGRNRTVLLFSVLKQQNIMVVKKKRFWVTLCYDRRRFIECNYWMI